MGGGSGMGSTKKFCYDREVVRGSAHGRGDRRCKGNVTGGNNKVLGRFVSTIALLFVSDFCQI